MREASQIGIYHVEINESIASEEVSIWVRIDITSQAHLARVVARRYGRAEPGICIKIASEPKSAPMEGQIAVPKHTHTVAGVDRTNPNT